MLCVPHKCPNTIHVYRLKSMQEETDEKKQNRAKIALAFERLGGAFERPLGLALAFERLPGAFEWPEAMFFPWPWRSNAPVGRSNGKPRNAPLRTISAKTPFFPTSNSKNLPFSSPNFPQHSTHIIWTSLTYKMHKPKHAKWIGRKIYNFFPLSSLFSFLLLPHFFNSFNSSLTQLTSYKHQHTHTPLHIQEKSNTKPTLLPLFPFFSFLLFSLTINTRTHTHIQAFKRHEGRRKHKR